MVGKSLLTEFGHRPRRAIHHRSNEYDRANFEFPVSVYVPLAITFGPFVITINKAETSFQSRIHVLRRGPFVFA
jgi:hypothetical protein